jgi:hypothetical protein
MANQQFGAGRIFFFLWLIRRIKDRRRQRQEQQVNTQREDT